MLVFIHGRLKLCLSMKLSELKAEVYRVAEVSTTRQLKATYATVKSLDMRYKVSWEKALVQVRKSNVADRAASNFKEPSQKTSSAASSVGKRPSGFEDWLNNPSDEYKALFEEADSALDSFDKKIENTKRLTKTVKAMAEGLDEFAEASTAEAKQLLQAVQRSSEFSKQTDLN